MATVVTRSRNAGKKKLSKRQRELVVDLTEWSLDRLLGSKLTDSVRVTVYMDGTLFEKTKTYGLSVWEDKYRRGREFSLEVDTSVDFTAVLQTVAHECVHIKQWAVGEYFAVDDGAWVYEFRGATYDTREVDYWDLPWEIEAYGRMTGLIVNWVKERGLSEEDWYKKPMVVF